MLAHKLAVTLTPAWLHYAATCLRTVDTLTPTHRYRSGTLPHTLTEIGEETERDKWTCRQVIMLGCERIPHLNTCSKENTILSQCRAV